MKSNLPGKKIEILTGSVWKNLLIFAMPLAATSILQQLFNSADTAVVGRFAGSDALAAVGGNIVAVGLAINALVGFSVGPNVVMARLIGEGKSEEARRVIQTTLFSAVALGLIFTIIGEFFAVLFHHVLGTPDAIMEQAVLYFRLYLAGLPFMAVYNFSAALIRSMGDTKRPLICLVISGIVNVGLNLIFVIFLKMGVAGVALATVLSNVLSAVLIVSILFKDQNMKITKGIFKPDKRYLKRIFLEGTPAAIQSSVFSVSNLFVQSAINSFGEAAIAGASAGVNAEFFAYGMTSAFTQGTVTFTSQNYGAGNLDRCKKVFRIAEMEGILLCAIMSISFFIFRYQFAGIYTQDSDVIAFAARRIAVVGVLEFMTVFYEVASGSLRGMGHPFVPSIITLAGTVGFRIAWIYTIFKFFNTFDSVSAIYPASWAFTAVMMFTAHYICMKKVCNKSE